MAKPTVAIPLRQTHTSREKFPHLENNVPLLSSANFMQIVEDDGGGTNDVKMAGESLSKKANPSLLSHKDQCAND